MLKSAQNIMHEQVVIPGGSPVRVKWNDFPHFTFPWHFHSEYEIVFVLKSHGVRFVADSYEKFQEGDLVLVGSQVPHYWKNDDAFHQKNRNLRVNAIVVQFAADFMEQPIKNYPEMSSIQELLQRSSRGIHFSSSFAYQLEDKLKDLHAKAGFDRLILLLKILDRMSKTDDYKLLGSPNFQGHPLEVKDQRLRKALNYIGLNYTQQMAISELAFRFGMNTSAFSRYFKMNTGKTPVEYINEIRISYACKLIRSQDLSISQICFECGFNNISNFNRIFKSQLKMTPTEYSNSIT